MLTTSVLCRVHQVCPATICNTCASKLVDITMNPNDKTYVSSEVRESHIFAIQQ